MAKTQTATATTTAPLAPFGDNLTANEGVAIMDAQDIADRSGCPCGVWDRDGWYMVCDVAPELIEPDPELSGWRLYAVVDPHDEA
jgi:hypothetical protein